ncbi:MAG TPA: phosphatase PAP2 family protein [Candidatus Absconditabacterales bacterium]|nr:phosphatase PAP2 family protein [Candidatus Absconditabacterales bacterium]
MIPMQEPIWGKNLLLFLNEYIKYNDFLMYSVPLSADIFVFFYPVLLVILYIVGIVKNKIYYKESALWIFWAGVLSMLVNISTQLFFDKLRPNLLLGMDYEKIETILHRFLPQSSFPSDHAATSMGIAVALFLWGSKNKDKKFKYLGAIFLLFAVIMGISRVAVGVHWPTDIIAGFIIGVLVPIVLFQKQVYKLLKKILITPIINIQKWIWKLFK